MLRVGLDNLAGMRESEIALALPVVRPDGPDDRMDTGSMGCLGCFNAPDGGVSEERIWLVYGSSPMSHRLRTGVPDSRGRTPAGVRDLSVEEARQWARERGEQAVADLEALLRMSGLVGRTF